MKKEQLNNYQDSFIHNEVWQLTFGGAFQRVGIYKVNASESEKGYNVIKKFKE